MNLLVDDQPRGGGNASSTSSGSWDTDPLDAPSNFTEELQGLAAKGLTVPLTRKSQPKQGEEEANVHLLQTVWCRYAGQDSSQPTNIWSAALSKLAIAQAAEQEQVKRQRQQQAQRLPAFSGQLNAQHPAHLITKELVQDQVHSLMPACREDFAAPPPAAGQDVWAKANCVHNSQASAKSAQQELAELLDGDHMEGSAAYHTRPHMEQQNKPHMSAEWGQASTQLVPPTSNVASDHHGPARSLLSLSSLSPIPSGDLSQAMSWNQLNSPGRSHKLQQLQHQQHQHQQSHLPSGLVGCSPISPLGAASSDAWWLQHNNQGPARLDSLPGSAQHTHLLQGSVTHNRMLGMGQYAMEAAAAPPSSYVAPKQEQPEVPQWLRAVQADTARAVRPRHSTPQDFAHPSDLPRPSGFFSSASYAGREDSGDLSTSMGASVFLGRACSGTQGAAGTILPLSMNSPKSSLGSSLPSMPPSLAQIAQTNSSRGGNVGVQGGQPSPAKLLMQLVAAPSTFSLPLCTGKQLNPPFRVRVAMLSEVPTTMPLTLKAYVLSKDNLAALDRWHPVQHTVTEEVSGGEVQQTVLCNEGQGEVSGEAGGGGSGPDGEVSNLLGGVADFVFKDLKFKASSRMKPRWLVIAAVLPTQDVMYVQYNVPTIIMSRACDQLTKAMNTLKGVEQTSTSVVSGGRKRTRPSNSPPKIVSVKSEDLVKHTSPTLLSSSAAELDATDSLDWPTTGPFTYHRWHVMVERKYNAFNLVRPLGYDDLHMMERVAGFHDAGDLQTCLVSELSPQKWAYFGAWYLSYLKIFRCHQQLWKMQSPMAICGFGMDRQRAQRLLQDQPEGTFLVRPGLSLAGCMVISASVAGSACKHMALDGNQLESRSLEVWVRDVLEAQQLLDYQTGERYSKAEVFQVHYQQFGVVSDGSADITSQGQTASRLHRLGLPPVLPGGH